MPNHLHLVVYFKKDNRLSDFMRDFKKFTSGEVRRSLEEENKLNILQKLEYKNQNQKFKVWQDRFDDVMLESKYIVETKIDYINLNPVKAGLCKLPEEFTFSSGSFYDTGLNISPLAIVDYRVYF